MTTVIIHERYGLKELEHTAKSLIARANFVVTKENQKSPILWLPDNFESWKETEKLLYQSRYRTLLRHENGKFVYNKDSEKDIMNKKD